MEGLELTRHRPKNPPSKTLAEQRKITAKVKNSDANRRITNMTRTTEEQARQKLTADLPRMERFIEDLDREAAIRNVGTPEMRLSGARLLERDAMQLTQDGAEDYGSALRQAAGVVDVADPADVGERPARRLGDAHHGDAGELESIVNERMKTYPENYEK